MNRRRFLFLSGAAATVAPDTLTLRDKQGRVVTLPMYEAACALLRSLTARSPDLADAVRHAFTELGASNWQRVMPPQHAQ